MKNYRFKDFLKPIPEEILLWVMETPVLSAPLAIAWGSAWYGLIPPAVTYLGMRAYEKWGANKEEKIMMQNSKKVWSINDNDCKDEEDCKDDLEDKIDETEKPANFQTETAQLGDKK